MRILQINTFCGKGSTGRNAVELATSLSEQGIEMYIAYGQGSTKYSKSYKIGSKAENHFHNMKSYILCQY